MSRKPAERPAEEQLSLLGNPKPKAPGQEIAQAPAASTSTSTSMPSRQPEAAEVPPAAAPPPPQVPPQPRIYLVSELLKAVRLTLESRFADVRVEGEVSGLKRSGNGHIYFTLKDADAQLDCVIYSREASRLKFTLEEGMAVRCRGRLTIYEARGRFQMTVDKI